jgi:DNA-binding GntR family transcriptional regulator
MSRIMVRNLADDVFERVQHDIMSGALPPKTPLRQDALAERLGVSTIPIREALARLEQLGVVVSQPRRGWVVRPLLAAEAEEIFDLRLALEPKTAVLGSLAAEEDDHRRAEYALAELEAEVRRAGPYAGARNRDFHEALLLPAARPVTLDAVMRLHVLAERYVNLHLQPEGRADRAEDEHRTLLRAWCDKDARAVETLLASHISQTFTDLRDQIGRNTSG